MWYRRLAITPPGNSYTRRSWESTTVSTARRRYSQSGGSIPKMNAAPGELFFVPSPGDYRTTIGRYKKKLALSFTAGSEYLCLEHLRASCLPLRIYLAVVDFSASVRNDCWHCGRYRLMDACTSLSLSFFKSRKSRTCSIYKL